MIPGQGTRSCMWQLKIPDATTKTQHSQINTQKIKCDTNGLIHETREQTCGCQGGGRGSLGLAEANSCIQVNKRDPTTQHKTPDSTSCDKPHIKHYEKEYTCTHGKLSHCVEQEKPTQRCKSTIKTRVTVLCK